MLFPEEHAPHLKNWIVKRLENTSDADSDVLADYVLALLRHDGDVNDVRKLCETEIPDFLKEDPAAFVNDVFEAISYRSYLPGAPPPPSKSVPAPAPPPASQPPDALYYDDTPMPSAPTYQPAPIHTGSRKRAYNDWDDPNNQPGRDGSEFVSRSFKYQKRGGAYGGRGGRSDDSNGYRVPNPSNMPTFPPPGQPPLQSTPPAPSSVGYFDTSGAMNSMFGMNLGVANSMTGFMPGSWGQQQPHKKRAKCRDWERKGYCQRGANCMFEHSNDPVYPTPMFGSIPPAPQPAAVEEYDPKNALMSGFSNGFHSLLGRQTQGLDSDHPKYKAGKNQNRQKRGDKAPFSADGPVFDRTKSTIVVENIPEENFTEDQVRSFFSQFGKVLEISMQPYKRLAIIKYDSWSSANAAYQSPKVIFDNRFVKVFWYKDDDSTLPPSMSLPGSAPVNRSHSTNGASSVGSQAPMGQSPVDLEEFARKQEEKQKAFEEKQRKRAELDRQKEELERRQRELLEEKAKLEAKLSRRDSVRSSQAGESVNGDDSKSSSKPTSQTEALRAQLAALEAEARQMGLDPDSIVESPASWPAARGGYGSYGRGRGRGPWRGYSYSPRGASRGLFRGRVNLHAAYAAYSIDNRPKKVVLTGVDFTASDKDETLRQYLFGIGEFTDIQTTPTSAEITFKDRKTAEKFFNSVLFNGKEIPGIETPVELAWGTNNGSTGSVPTTPGNTAANLTTPTATSAGGLANHASSSSAGVSNMTSGVGVKNTTQAADVSDNMSAEPATTAATTAGSVSGGEGEDAGASSSDKDVHILLDRPPTDRMHDRERDQNEMDYEVADENQWGY